jgi:uncharacterized protein with beta-barrel porin domain
MKIRHYLLGSCLPALAFVISTSAVAQVEITDAQTSNVSTSTAGDGGTPADVTITSTGSVAVTTGTAVTLDSSNALVNSGSITTVDADNTTGVLISGANTGSLSNIGTIGLTETAPTDGITAGGDIAQGTGRTGILISGASPFIGNIENNASGIINVQGQNSSGIRLDASSSVTGDILQSGTLSVSGENSAGINLAGTVIGNLALTGPVSAVGENSVGVDVSGDLSGTLSTTDSITTTAYFTSTGQAIVSRPFLVTRDDIAENGIVDQAGSAISVSANIGNGILLGQTVVESTDDTTGITTSVVTASSNISMIGSAPAILIDGNGTPIAIGRVAQITAPANADYDAELQYAFVNQGALSANGILDDINATAFSLADASLEDGLNNSGSMTANVFRSGIDPAATTATNDAHARVIVIGGGGIADHINNTGSIVATAQEATDSIYADPDNVLAANQIFATAIEVDAGGTLNSLTNISAINAILIARDGTAVAVRDASGTLTQLSNSGTIGAFGTSSDVTGAQATNLSLIAIDVSANTSGFTLDQTAFTDPDTDTTTTPGIFGEILLGSGDDTLNIASGSVIGDIAFGDGADLLNISNSATVAAAITDSDGQLEILVADNSALTITGASQIDVTDASFDGTSTYSPFIDPATGNASLLNASGTVSFEDGAVVAPRLANVLDSGTAASSFEIVDAGTLLIGDILGSARTDATPFLYNTTLSLDPTDSNTLILTLDLRSTSELGLDSSQTAFFSSAFEALQNSDPLGAAFTQITDQGSFNAAFNQLLPEFAAASRQFTVANIDGATGAIGSHLDTARRSPERPGGAWIEEFVYYADRELAGLSEQFRGYGFGITGGFDTSIGPFQTAGINLGFATTEIEDVVGQDEPLDVLTLQAGLYAGYKTGDLGIDLYAGGGYTDYESSRVVDTGDFRQVARGDWGGTHINASASAGYDITFGRYFARPSATVSYLRLSENSYTETGDSGITQIIDARTSDIGTATGILSVGAKFERDRFWWAPGLRFGYRNDFMNDAVITTGRFVNGTTPFSLASQEFPNSGIVLGVTFAAGSKYSSFGIDIDSDIRDGFIRHTGRLVLRMLF